MVITSLIQIGLLALIVASILFLRHEVGHLMGCIEEINKMLEHQIAVNERNDARIKALEDKTCRD